ncbi:hypothetical protein FisN_29Hu012 [Fistulifera solaris]|uniref:Uncharacterized protein n=1 Tax=Fistulifera solaris TaxID=1519565 RepID=A0A1Z5K5P4_FISSO|nr:hypothetical protein FisN_29Hu012 [Fistulifera solaris]|eukprot:GAX21580.1 hypothetical protein FisN_29Hu012 [Fistulifera solaris]
MKAFSSLIASAFLFGHGLAIFQESQFLPRSLLPCGNRGGSEPVKKCDTYIGQGVCANEFERQYDYCYGAINAHSLEQCQLEAAKMGAIGMDYYEDANGTTRCQPLFDNQVTSTEGFACPDGFQLEKVWDGTGPITKVRPSSILTCYSCE